MSEILKILPSLLVVGGWMIVYQLQALQARRKVLREEVEKARAAVLTLNGDALRFHMSAHSIADRLALVAALTDIERRCELFPQISVARRTWLPDAVPTNKAKVDSALIVNVRQAITLNHFDDESAAPLSVGSTQLEEITAACTALVRSVDGVMVAALD